MPKYILGAIQKRFCFSVHNNNNAAVLESKNNNCIAKILLCIWMVYKDCKMWQKQINNTSNSLIILHKCTKWCSSYDYRRDMNSSIYYYMMVAIWKLFIFDKVIWPHNFIFLKTRTCSFLPTPLPTTQKWFKPKQRKTMVIQATRLNHIHQYSFNLNCNMGSHHNHVSQAHVTMRDQNTTQTSLLPYKSPYSVLCLWKYIQWRMKCMGLNSKTHMLYIYSDSTVHLIWNLVEYMLKYE